jgi:hypothetical protein
MVIDIALHEAIEIASDGTDIFSNSASIAMENDSRLCFPDNIESFESIRE